GPQETEQRQFRAVEDEGRGRPVQQSRRAGQAGRAQLPALAVRPPDSRRTGSASAWLARSALPLGVRSVRKRAAPSLPSRRQAGPPCSPQFTISIAAPPRRALY